MIGLEGAPHWGELVKRVFGENEIVPPGVIIDDRTPVHWEIHKRFLWGSSHFFAGAVAAISNGFGFRNPPTAKNQLVVITRVQSIVGSGDMNVLDVSNIVPLNYVEGGAPGLFKADTRWLGNLLNANSLTKVAGGLTATLSSTLILGNGQQSSDDFFRVLLPGFFVVLESTGVNAVFNANIYGYVVQVRVEELVE